MYFSSYSSIRKDGFCHGCSRNSRNTAFATVVEKITFLNKLMSQKHQVFTLHVLETFDLIKSSS
jgi:hypothetical protein